MKRPPLTPKQARFVEEYSLDHNGAAAAVRAGYAPKSSRVAACKLVAKANVQAAVAVREADAAKVLNLTREDVLAALQKAYGDARAQSDPWGVMILAAREVARICGFYAPERHQVAVTSTPAAAAMVAKFNAMTDTELIAILEG